MTTRPFSAANPITSVARRGGVAATHEFAADGVSRRRLAAHVRSGRIIRVRQGWYARPGTHPNLVSATRVGGVLSCSSALSLAGFWVVSDGRLHVAVGANDCQLRSPHDARGRLHPAHPVTVHWRPAPVSPGQSRLIADPITALADLATCTTPELLTAAADSVISHRNELTGEVRQLARTLWPTARAALQDADGICESGTETLLWLRMRHLRPRRQIAIRGVGRVDFVFGERLIVEVDGEEFHSGATQFEADRRRDALLSARGFRVLRFSYQQVMYRWPEVHAAVIAALLRGDRD